MKRILFFSILSILVYSINAQETILKEIYKEKINEQRMLKHQFSSLPASNIVDCFEYSWNALSGTWSENPTGKYDYIYDGHGRNTGYYKYTWNTSTNKWQNLTELLYLFDDNDNITVTTINKWNENTNSWIPYSVDTTIYSNFNVLIRETWSLYDPIKEKWRTYNLWRYNSNGAIIEEYYFAWDENYEIAWGERLLYALNMFNDPIEIIAQSYNIYSNLWENEQQGLLYYTDKKLIRENISNWLDSEWSLTFQYNYLYNNNLLKEKLGQKWDGSTWSISNHTIYSYNQNNLISISLTQNGDGLTWNNSSRYVYSYDEQNRRTEKLYQNWKDTIWVNNSQVFNSFDNRGNRIEYFFKYYSFNSGLATSGYRQQFVFNSNNLLTEYYYQGWDTETNDWLYSTKKIYFYSIFNAVIDNTETKNCICYIENPYKINQPIVCPKLNLNENYKITVYNLYGESVYQNSFTGGESAKINTQLTNSLYIITITNHNKIVYRNKILVN